MNRIEFANKIFQALALFTIASFFAMLYPRQIPAWPLPEGLELPRGLGWEVSGFFTSWSWLFASVAILAGIVIFVQASMRRFRALRLPTWAATLPVILYVLAMIGDNISSYRAERYGEAGIDLVSRGDNPMGYFALALFAVLLLLNILIGFLMPENES